LGAAHVAVSGLQQLEDDVLHVLTDVTGLGEGRGVYDGKGHVQHLGQGLCQKRLARSGRPDEQDVGLGQLHLAGPLPVHMDALVVVVNGNRQLLLGLLLADDVLVEEHFDFLRLGQVVGSGSGVGLGTVVFQNRVADGHALVTDVGPRVVAGRGDQFGDGILGFVAERAAQNFIRSRPWLHVVTPCYLTRTLETCAPSYLCL
jgi:hypothetical protein